MTVASCGRMVLVAAVLLLGGRGWSGEPADPGTNVPPDQKAASEQKPEIRPGQQQPTVVEPVPGYVYRVVEGFQVLINESVLAQQENSRFTRRPLDVLQHELKLVSSLLPSNAVAVLRTVPIWVEWKKPGSTGVVAVYHAGPTVRDRRPGVVFLFNSLEQRAKSNAVEIVNMESLTVEHQPQTDSGRCVLLHELSHAVHHHLFDSKNVYIKAAYEQAIARGLYQGRYAATNEREYFAELSCAYFDKLAYPPRSQAELREYDPIGYRMMELTWGTPEQILAIRDAVARRGYGQVVGKLRGLIRNGKLEEARAIHNEFQSYYRGTKTAERAREQFNKFVEAEENRAANR